jgi:putative redox protein
MAIAAAKLSLDLDLSGMRAIVRKHMTAEPPRRIQRLEVSVKIPLPETLPSRATLEGAARNCPVALSLHPEIEKAVTFSWRS